MTKTQRLMNPLLLVLSMIFALGTEARSTDSLRWTPEWGAALTTELQVTTTGRHRSTTGEDAFLRNNCANLLKLQASLPIVHGFSLDVGSISTFMTSRESIGDDLQTFSNLDAERIPFALSVCGVNWDINDRHSLFLGIRNMNEDYFCSPVTSLFTNSSCGIFPTIGANYNIANYPMASMGMHYRYSRARGVGQGVGLQASLYNGIGSYRLSGHENVFRFCPKSDGIFGLAEAQYHRGGSSYFLGACVRSFFPAGKAEGGLWTYTEQRITGRLSLIAGYSHAFGHDVACRDFAGVGAHYQLRRAELGLFTDYANFAEGSEFSTELTSKVNLTSYLFLQPSVHLIATSSKFQGAATLRLGVAF